MISYSGKCIGGPYDGQMMAHWSKTRKLFRPPVPAFANCPEIEAIPIGEYRLNDFGQWHWWETEAGRAWKVLYD
jgi:hypothetical protein